MDLQPRPAEVQQQAQTQVAGFEVVHALRAMHIVERANRLQFDGDRLLDQQVGDILSDMMQIWMANGNQVWMRACMKPKRGCI